MQEDGGLAFIDTATFGSLLRNAFHLDGQTQKVYGNLASQVFWVSVGFFYFKTDFEIWALWGFSDQEHTAGFRLWVSKPALPWELIFPCVNSWNWIYCSHLPTSAFRLQLCQATVTPSVVPAKWRTVRPAIFGPVTGERVWVCAPSVLACGWVRFGGRGSCAVIYLEFLVTFTVVNGIFSFP